MKSKIVIASILIITAVIAMGNSSVVDMTICMALAAVLAVIFDNADSSDESQKHKSHV